MLAHGIIHVFSNGGFGVAHYGWKNRVAFFGSLVISSVRFVIAVGVAAPDDEDRECGSFLP
jgi:hypothetical protein